MTDLSFFISAELISLICPFFHLASLSKFLLSWRESPWQLKKKKKKNYSAKSKGVAISSTRISKQAPWEQKIGLALRENERLNTNNSISKRSLLLQHLFLKLPLQSCHYTSKAISNFRTIPLMPHLFNFLIINNVTHRSDL